ncbi:MAG: protein kinase [Myxococcaceae bacterium]|nr:protein kinase [Myxococcaceae bacterium]
MAGQSFIAPSTALDRRRLGKFEVLCRLSTGGMSQIYLATQSGIGGFRKLVVLKTILPDIGGEEDFVRMFLEEARTTAAFAHPNIAQVFELDVDAGELFMAMEFVQGCTLVEMAKACRSAREPIPIGFTLQSVRDTALALHYAHNFTDARGRKQIVIHRDVAEKNIMVTYDGVTKLLDFGIAKALGRSSRTSIGMVKGTSGYMSPEQIRGEPLDPRSDVFSLGVVLHECLTGLRLFHGKSAEDGMVAALNTAVAPPSRTNPEVTPDVDAVVLKALQRKREDRFGTALEFARAIEKAAPGRIWHPEQSGELVSRHFADRRQETRRILESTSFGAETTGELKIDALLAKVKGFDKSANQQTQPPAALTPVNTEPVPPARAPAPTPPTGLPNSLRRPSLGAVPVAPSPVPAPAPVAAAPAPEPDTSPARPKVLRGTPSAENIPLAAVSQPLVVKLDGFGRGYDDDSEAKTIPAAALPEEIKALRAKLLQKNAPAPQKVTEANPALKREPSVEVTDSPRPVPPNNVKTIPAGSASSPARTNTGETLSITSKGAVPGWSDEEPEAKTAIGLPFDRNELQQRRATPPRPKPPEHTKVEEEDDDEDFRETVAAATQGRSTVLLVAILVPLFIAAVIAVLYAFDLPPFAANEAEPPKRTTVEPTRVPNPPPSTPSPAPEG